MERKAGQKMSPVVFISGAGRGLGLCLTELFLKNGYTVLAGQYRVTEGLERLVARFGGPLHCIPLNVTDDDSVAAAATAANSLTDGLDVLINNAAICEDEGGRIEQADFERVARIINVNTLGPLRLSKALLPLLSKGSMMTIVNISSEAGSIADCWRKGMFGYSMSKAALNMQTRLLSNYLGNDGFRVLSIHPGWMKTDMGGANADIEPGEAADGIFKIVTNPTATDKKELFIDYKGNALRY
jgi:NAD(P)-dependent dehydrogenase (short-subunit alcohol dehydrogenase family)